MARVDLTDFGFTPTESLVYEVLLTVGPGTGYAIARAAGLARANAYSALESLVTKGGARVESGRPRRYHPEAPAALVARISNDHGQALDRLSRELDGLAIPATATLVEIESARALLQLISHDLSLAVRTVLLLAPADAYPLLAPALRRPAGAGVSLLLCAPTPASLDFATVELVPVRHAWPGMPVIAVMDDQRATIAARQGSDVRGHWSSAPTFVAAARLAFERCRAPV